MILGLVIVVELQVVTDRQTDRQTHNDSIHRANVASLGKNWRVHQVTGDHLEMFIKTEVTSCTLSIQYNSESEALTDR